MPQAESNSDDELMATVSEMTNASWHGLLAALSLLLDAAQDETARELVLKSHQDFASLCGSLGIDVARDAFITALCKASLPPHYDLFITGVKHGEVGYFDVYSFIVANVDWGVLLTNTSHPNDCQ